MTDLIALHAEFWDFRRMMALYWIIPDNPDAARFAVTEAAEVLKTNGLWEAFVAFAASRQAQIAAADALDAVLRRNASYSRNTIRDMDERNELGDLAMMLLTTAGEHPLKKGEIYDNPKLPNRSIDQIVEAVSYVHTHAFRGEEVRSWCLMALAYIDGYPGMDLPLILRSRMKRIYRKHHPDAGRTFPVAEGEAYQNETPAAYTIQQEGCTQ